MGDLFIVWLLACFRLVAYFTLKSLKCLLTYDCTKEAYFQSESTDDCAMCVFKHKNICTQSHRIYRKREKEKKKMQARVRQEFEVSAAAVLYCPKSI